MYSYDESYQKSLEYFNGQELAAKVFVDKYALRNNAGNLLELTPDDMHKRLAKAFARVEANKFKTPLSEAEIYNLFKNFRKFIPQGGPMMGIDNDEQICSLSNCFVLESPVDSYSGILHTDEQLVQISKRRGGCGISLDNLRPEGSPTKNSSRTSTGIVSWMRRYSSSTREVGQGGRRGALMLTINVHHPDVLKFATIKNNSSEVTGANISVALTDEFLEAVKNDTDYEQRWPIKAKKPSISKKVNAREVWKTIVNSAWLRAEPGILFWDSIIRLSPADCYGKFGYNTVSTNPCQPAWAKVLTKEGIRKLIDVNIGDDIWSSEGWTKVINKWSTGVKKVYKYQTTAGIFYGTENHRLISHGEKIEAKDCECIDIITGPNVLNVKLNPQDIIDGLVVGDGSVHKASNNKVYLDIGQDDNDYFTSEIKSLISAKNSIGPHSYDIYTTISYEDMNRTFNRKVPDRFIFGNTNKICSFLRGLYSANGSVCGNRITLKASSKQIIDDVQLMLSSIGIQSYYTTNKPTLINFDNGDYLCKQSYDLNITGDRDKFLRLIGFIQKYKNEKVILTDSKRRKTTFDIISVDLISEEEVFNITVDNNSHTYWTQGCNVGNCGEITLSELDSCRLLAINLFGYVQNPFTSKAKFNWEEFTKDVKIAQRLMDDLIDLELGRIDKIINKIESDPEDLYIKERELNLWKRIREVCLNGRRTGLGITALGDTIAALGVKYGTTESVELTEDIYYALKIGSYTSSVEMAKELGPFPIWDWSLEKDNEFITGLPEDLQNEIKQHGRRNIANLTTAPTGSISIMAGLEVNNKMYWGSTSGIEPIFLPSYTRRKKGNHKDSDFRVDFTDQNGDTWMHFEVYHSALQAWMDVNEEKDITKSPYHGACASDIDWINRVKLQAAAQKHIDHSISSTVNLPENISEEKVAEIYETAWRAGCKGITIYRDNCRTGVLVKKGIEKHDAPERPKELECDVHHISVKGKSYVILIGLFEGDPYEVFAGRGSLVDNKVKKGKIIRIRKNFYKAILDDETELSPITLGCSEDEETITRLVSGMLRHGAHPQFVQEQLTKVEGELTSYAKSIARSLKKYIEDGTKSTEDCPECNSKLIFSDGCKKCMTCGYSKCS